MEQPGGLVGRRILVVGGSAGIGRATSLAAAAAGAQVMAVARRAERLDDLVTESEGLDGGVIGLVADAGVAAEVAGAVDEAAASLGGLDAVIYTAAQTHLADIGTVDETVWQRLFMVNVVGAAATLAAAAPHLTRVGGRALLVTSDSVGHPFPGLGVYVATKAALGSVVRSWQVEHPELATSLVTVGPTSTEAASAWDGEALARMLPRWVDEGYLPPDLVPAQPEEVAIRLLAVLGSATLPTEIDLAPPRPWG